MAQWWETDTVVEHKPQGPSDAAPWWQSDQVNAPAEEAPTFLESMGRSAALGGRALLEAPANLFALPSDALFGLVNYIQAKRGQPMPFKLASQSIREGYTAAGLPEPETGAERLAYAVESGLAGAVPGIGTGQALAQSAAPVTRGVGQALAAAPGSQAVGAGSGALSQQVAAALGAPLPVQMAAGLVGGVAGGAAAPLAGAVRRGAMGTVEPITESGRRAVAGRVLRTGATDAERAATQLEQARHIVPGSAPTTGQAGADIGLAFMEQRLRGLTGDARFNQRYAQQNVARQTMLDSIAAGGTEPAIQVRTAHRETATAPLRALAFQQAQGQRVPVERVLATIDDLLANPENAGQSVQTALRSFRRQLTGPEETVMAPDGTQVTQSTPLTDARALYAVRKEINRVLESRHVNSDESVMRYAGGQLIAVKGAIDNAISAVAPSWNRYLERYSALSRPIERAQTVGDIRQRTAMAAPDIESGLDVTSQAKWRNVVTRALPELRETMTTPQVRRLEQIGRDLDRGAAAIAAGKVAGSDTAANLAVRGQISVANIVGRTLGRNPQNLAPGAATAARPLSWLYRIPDEAIREMLVEAMLDPALAAQLIREGTVENVAAFSAALQGSFRGATAGAASTSAAQQPGQ